MLPTKDEQAAKRLELFELIKNNELSRSTDELMENYAKWYAEQVIKHCAEVAEISYIGDPDYDYDFATVSRKSILDVIKEL
jgi:hypothetical protein